MILKADFRCKQVALEVEACVVEKVVELSTAEFDQFCRSMLEKYPFIREARASLHYDDGMRYGFLVLGVGRNDGILVDTQGADYARYSAFIPNARSLLTPDMGIDRSYLSPAEPWRNENRDEMLRMTLRVNGKPDYTLVLPADEEYLDAVKNYLDTAIKPITPEREQELVAKLVDFLSSRYDAGNLYDILHHALGMDHSDMEALGFQLRDYYEEVK